MNKAKYCIHGYISGKVQGVWFRDNTQKKAKALHLTGWVKNLTDGRVEVYACGEEDNLKQLAAWLWEGPDLAEVDNVEIKKSPWEEIDGFVVKYE